MLLTALGWIIGWAIFEALSLVINRPVGPLIGGAIVGSIGGAITGLALRRMASAVHWKQIVVIVLGWVVGVAAGGAISSAIGPDFGETAGRAINEILGSALDASAFYAIGGAIHEAILGAVSGGVGGTIMGLVLRQWEPAVKWKQASTIAFGWAVGWAIGWSLSRVIFEAIYRAVGWNLGWVISSALGWVIGAVIGSRSMYRQIDLARHCAAESQDLAQVESSHPGNPIWQSISVTILIWFLSFSAYLTVSGAGNLFWGVAFCLAALGGIVLLGRSDRACGLSLLTALGWVAGWSIGWGIGLALSLVFDVEASIIPPIDGGVFAGISWVAAWLLGGLSTGLALRRAVPAIHWKQVLAITLGWAFGGVLVMVLVTTGIVAVWEAAVAIGEIATLAIGGGVIAIVGGSVTGLVLRWAEPSLRWRQVFSIALGWIIGRAVGWATLAVVILNILIYLYNYEPGWDIDPTVGWIIIGIVTEAICGTIAGFIGSRITYWQLEQARRAGEAQ